MKVYRNRRRSFYRHIIVNYLIEGSVPTKYVTTDMIITILRMQEINLATTLENSISKVMKIKAKNLKTFYLK